MSERPETDGSPPGHGLPPGGNPNPYPPHPQNGSHPAIKSHRSGAPEVVERARRSAGRLYRFFASLSRFRKVVAAGTGLAMTSLLVAVTVIAYHAVQLPSPTLADLRRHTSSVELISAGGTTLARRGERHTYMPAEHLPQHLIAAVLSTEDRRFIDHFGVDIFGLLRAAFRNLRAGRYVQGGSTITQQLAKNIFLKPKRTMSRKIQEIILALWLEVRLSKKQILELYLNRVYFGAGAYGIEAAAERYFGKSARHLTLGESAVLAGLLKAPSRYSPMRDPALTLKRARIVLQNMINTGAITEAQAATVIERPIHFASAIPRKRAKFTDYAIDYIFDQLTEIVGEATGNIIVETTIDHRMQVRAQTLVEKHLNEQARARNAEEAAVVLLDKTGGIKALVGGRSYRASQFNRAIKAKRQPGSAFKPFVYLAALENGFTPDTVAYDEPITLKNWTPRNYRNRYIGPVTLRDALAQSINTVAVRIFLEVGRQQVVDAAERLGILSQLHSLPSLALGTAEVTPLELTAAYVPFSNGGFSMTPHIISRIRTAEGSVIYERPKEAPDRLLSSEAVGAMNDMLSTALTSGTGQRAIFPPYPAAGKTGTTQEFRDAWFVGYTSRYTAGVWVGNDHAKSMKKIVGGGLPARIWRDLMISAHENLEPEPLPGSYADRIRRKGPTTAQQTLGSNSNKIDQNFLAKVLGYAEVPEPKAEPESRPHKKTTGIFSERWKQVFYRD